MFRIVVWLQRCLRCRWLLEARFEHTLAIVVKVAGDDSLLRDARIDVGALAQQIERDSRLTWWRHAGDVQTG